MKNKWILLLGVLALTACEDSSELYNYPINKIGFLRENGENKPVTKTFIYDNSDVDRDTVYILMRTMAYVTEYDRTIGIQEAEPVFQERVEGANAVPGVHYVPFDDPEYQKFAVVKAGQAEAQLPVILLRDPSLENEEVTLRIRIVQNEAFAPINEEDSEKLVTFSDMIMQPEAWDDSFSNFFGTWGPVKFRFMLDVSGERWDDEFINTLWNDYPYMMFWQARLRVLLEEENARREAAGEGPLREEPAPGEIEGKLVSFP